MISRRRLLTYGLAASATGLPGLFGWSQLRGWGRMPRPDWKFPLHPPVWAAHRGGRALHPENTLLAFERAVRDYGCRFLDTDIHISADGVPVLIHDATVDRTTDGRGLVRELSLAQLKRLDAAARFTAPDGSRRPFCAIPTLEEALDAFPHCLFSAEMKPSEPGDELAVVNAVRRTGMTHHVLLGSASEAAFRRIQRAGPEIPSFFGASSALEFWLSALSGMDGWYVAPHHVLEIPERLGPLHVVTPRTVRTAKRLGLPIIVWTVNDEADMRRLLRIGVDGIMTDWPDRAARALSGTASPVGDSGRGGGPLPCESPPNSAGRCT